jgi:hypothetical protein
LSQCISTLDLFLLLLLRLPSLSLSLYIYIYIYITHTNYLYVNLLTKTAVTAFITHALFGKGRLWKGKIFFPTSDGSSMSKKEGINRFQSKSKITITDHKFDYSVCESSFQCGRNSLQHNYAPHHPSRFSPWRGMKDELRWIPCASSTSGVLIGMGYFDWSGGILNASPFLLVQDDIENVETLET